VSIFDAIRDQVSLDRLLSANSSGKTRCVAPGHQDNDPSMHLYGDHVHCFSCGFHGDVWAAIHGFDRPIEAALDMAREFGIDMPEASQEARQKAQERREKEDLNRRQAQACHRALGSYTSVQEWWESRGFGGELVERFLLGANKDGTAAVIPYWHRGRVQGLIRRRLGGEPRYLYPRAEDFPRGRRPLFIPGPIRDSVFLVEGIVDALAVAALGESVAAVGGTSMSRAQMQELERLPGPVYILPDTDEEGEQAAREWAQKLYPKAVMCPPQYSREAAHA
jgi:DNA primase